MALRDFDESTLWQVNAFPRPRAETTGSGFGPVRSVMLPSALIAALSQLESRQTSLPILEVLAACVRHRENALILLRLGGLVWPLTLFPQHNLHHLPRSIIASLRENGRDLAVIAVEPAGLHPPRHGQVERMSEGPGCRVNQPLLWAMAMYAPFSGLVAGIGGRAAYKITADTSDDGLAGGTVKFSLQRLRHDIASLHDVAAWPGMGIERAARLLNGAYLQGGLRILRTHPAARDEALAGAREPWLRRWR